MHLRSLLIPGAALVLASLATASDTSDTTRLTNDSFETVIEEEPIILVKFCIPSENCEALATHYEEAATSLKAKNIKIADVDCAEEVDLCEAYGIQDYPTLKVFQYGVWAHDYHGSHQAGGIISYMLHQFLPSVSEITATNHEQFLQQAANDKIIVVVAYLTSPTDVPADAFSMLADHRRDGSCVFGLTTDSDAIAAAGVTPPAIVAYRSFDEPKMQYPRPVSDATASDLDEWINDLSIPLLDKISASNHAAYAASPKPLAYLFLDPSDKQREARIDSMRPIAQKYKSEMNFAWMDAAEFGDPLSALDFEHVECTEVTSESAEASLQQLLQGAHDREPRSAPIPETQDELVFNLVAKQFDEIVFDHSKDLFLMFYTTQCEDCEHMKPEWDALAWEYAPLKDKITIARMDMQENDLPDSAPFYIAGYPAIVFRPAFSDEFIGYDGDSLTLEDLVVFVEVNTGHSGHTPEAAPVLPEIPEREVAQIPLGVETLSAE